MNRFFVGQRVRVIDSYQGKANGLEARIIGSGIKKEEDCWLLRIKNENNWFVEKSQANSCLEPILPKGAQASEFSFTELMDNLGVVVA